MLRQKLSNTHGQPQIFMIYEPDLSKQWKQIKNVTLFTSVRIENMCLVNKTFLNNANILETGLLMKILWGFYQIITNTIVKF